MKEAAIHILYEDADVVVCEKPFGVPSQSDKSLDYDMVNRLKNYLFLKQETKGEPYVGLIHRLDRPVGGIMVFAKNKESAKKLSESIRSKEISKKYLAIVTCDPKAPMPVGKHTLTDYIAKEAKTNTAYLAKASDKQAKKAELIYQVIDKKEDCLLVEVELLTGRHHQIRLQLASHLGGIWGDTKYNPLFREKKGAFQIGLYAYQLSFLHPRNKKVLTFSCKPKGIPFDFFSLTE
ncbi:MAG: rRNA synthase [Clostridiales bacterium]|nr:rRNA synthase [Clostridiales bacterium]